MASTATALATYEPAPIVPIRQADNDGQVIALWLHGRPESTAKAYAGDLDTFQAFIGRLSLVRVRLIDLQEYTDSMADLKPRSTARKLATLKSLFRFAVRIGYLKFDPAAALKSPKVPSDLADRILSEREVHKMIDREANPRNRIILDLLYRSGCRVSEIAALTWRNVKSRDDGNGGTLHVTGKGSKSRAVRLYDPLWSELAAMRGEAPDTAPVFVSRKGQGALGVRELRRIVTKAGERIGLKASPHFMRHSHGTHAVNRGCPLHVVQSTLGHSSLATTGKYLHVSPGESSGKFLG
jgi:integrase/recombinase XerD